MINNNFTDYKNGKIDNPFKQEICKTDYTNLIKMAKIAKITYIPNKDFKMKAYTEVGREIPLPKNITNLILNLLPLKDKLNFGGTCQENSRIVDATLTIAEQEKKAAFILKIKSLSSESIIKDLQSIKNLSQLLDMEKIEMAFNAIDIHKLFFDEIKFLSKFLTTQGELKEEITKLKHGLICEIMQILKKPKLLQNLKKYKNEIHIILRECINLVQK